MSRICLFLLVFLIPVISEDQINEIEMNILPAPFKSFVVIPIGAMRNHRGKPVVPASAAVRSQSWKMVFSCERRDAIVDLTTFSLHSPPISPGMRSRPLSIASHVTSEKIGS